MQSVQFLDVLNRLIPASVLDQIRAEFGPRARTAPKLPAAKLISGLIYHQLQEGGTLAKNSGKLHGIHMSDSAHAQRQQLLRANCLSRFCKRHCRRWPIQTRIRSMRRPEH